MATTHEVFLELDTFDIVCVAMAKRAHFRSLLIPQALFISEQDVNK